MTSPARWAALVVGLAAFGCASSGGPEPSGSTSASPNASTSATPLLVAELPTAAQPVTCGSLALTFSGAVPPDASLGSQTDADCFGWQEFIALNWPAEGTSFGQPGDRSPVQWQGYMNVHQLFQPDASPPPPWGTPPKITAECLAEAKLTPEKARAVHPLLGASKFSSEFISGSDTAEAFPFNAPSWLGDVNGNNVWFEVRVNEDEYDFVVQNQFYDATKQLAFYASQAQPPAIPLQLPSGNTQTGAVGAIELKAAWMEVSNPSDPRWNDYKLTDAVVVDPTTQKCEQVTVALVALHILHKTETQPTWIWATFEHVRNAPSATDATGESWNFNSGACTSQSVSVPPACQVNGQASVKTTCAPNTPPAYEIGDGCPAPTPTQVTRVNAIDPTAATVNGIAQKAIDAAFPGSVWQNYMLVNVVWSTNPPSIPPACKAGTPGCQSVTTPQLTQSLPPGAIANSVLETYIQDHNPTNPFGAKSNCVLCHQSAAVPNAPAATPYASDFSFALGLAETPPSGALAKTALEKKGLQKKVRRIFR